MGAYRVLALSSFVLGVGCGGTDNPNASGTAGSSGGSGIPTVTDSASGTGDTFDLGDGMPTGSAEAGSMVCKKVDVVIAVDNSGSMQEEIEALRGPVFDSFPQTLLDVGNGLDDFRLAVIDACNDPPNFHTHGKSGDCNFSTGTNHMVSTSPTLTTEYACVTDLTPDGYLGMPDGCSGSNDDEQPANTAADTVSPPAVDGANAGFVRDDAVLFVVAITDEDEKPLPIQTAVEVADKLIAAKGGVNNVVLLGIGGGSNCDGPYGSADDAVFLREITQIFVDAGRGLFWDLCQGDLEMAFQAALDVVDSACNDFVPAG